MNFTSDFTGVLINNREKIVDKLLQNYSYEYLLKIFENINMEKGDNINISPNDKYLYRILTGIYEASQYDKSAIDWIPSEELIDGILKLIEYYQIESVEEIHTGMGILSLILKKKNQTIKITTADTCENISTCNKLDLTQIAKRNVFDYQYYLQLNEPYPEMIISTYYPMININNSDNDIKYINEILQLVKNNNNKLIILILPHTFTNYYYLFYHFITKSQYTINSYYIKALDKYFHVTNLLKDHYPSGMVAHILVQKNNGLDNNTFLDNIFEKAICNYTNIDTHCVFAEKLTYYYDKISDKLIKNIYQSHNFMDCGIYNKQINLIFTKLGKLVEIDKINIPQYIYKMDEFIFWLHCYELNLYFIFENRVLFFQYYTDAISMENSEIRRQINFPYWITNMGSIYKYIYLQTLNYAGNWKNNKISFDSTFNEINKNNKITLKQNK